MKIKTSVSIEENILKKFQEEANKEGRSLSNWLEMVAKNSLNKSNPAHINSCAEKRKSATR